MELLTEELIELHDKHRLGRLTPADMERLATLLKDPGRKAAWDDLERIAKQYQDVPAGKLPKDFTASVMQSIRTLSAAKEGRFDPPAASAPVKPLTKRENPWRNVWVWAPAAALAVAAAVVGRLTVLIPQATTGASSAITYDCHPENASVQGSTVPLSQIAHSQPAKIVVQAGAGVPQVGQPAPEALMCAEMEADHCARWSPAAQAVINYACLKRETASRER